MLAIGQFADNEGNMSTSLLQPEKVVDEISGFEAGLHALVTRNDAPDGTASLVDRARDTSTRLLELWKAGVSLELSDSLREEIKDHLLAALAELSKVTTTTDEEAARRAAVRTLVHLEALRHILRDGIDHEPFRTLHADGKHYLSRADAVRNLGDWLPRLTRDDQARILGLSDARQVLRWSAAEETPASRAADLAVELAGVLRHSWTDEGVLRWFERAHPMLDGRPPFDVVDDIDFEQRLRAAARATRAQRAT